MTCFLCKAKGHYKSHCPKKASDGDAVFYGRCGVSCDGEHIYNRRFREKKIPLSIDDSPLKVNKINRKVCSLIVLLDIVSPASFITPSAFVNYFNCTLNLLKPSLRTFVQLR